MSRKYRIIDGPFGFSVLMWFEWIIKPNLFQKYFHGKTTEVKGEWKLIDEMGWCYSMYSTFPPAIYNNIKDAEYLINRLNKVPKVVNEITFE